jgi:hypothetical protein
MSRINTQALSAAVEQIDGVGEIDADASSWGGVEWSTVESVIHELAHLLALGWSLGDAWHEHPKSVDAAILDAFHFGNALADQNEYRAAAITWHALKHLGAPRATLRKPQRTLQLHEYDGAKREFARHVELHVSSRKGAMLARLMIREGVVAPQETKP